MAKRRRKRKYGKKSRKSAKRVRAGKKAYKKTGLYKYNLKRKKAKHGRKTRRRRGKR